MAGTHSGQIPLTKMTLIALVTHSFLLLVSVQGFQLPSTGVSTLQKTTNPPYAFSSSSRKQSPLTRRYQSTGSSASSSNSGDQKTSGSTNGDSSPPRKQRSPRSAVLKLKNMVGGTIRRFVSIQSRMVSNFKRLSKKAKILVVAYMMVFTLLLGSMGKTAYQRHKGRTDFPVNRTPIEITYSSFMDLVEQQKTTPPGGSTDSPSMDKVRIAPDRISFRLNKPVDAEGATTTTSKGGAPKTKYLSVYTRKPPASQETIDYLRSNNLEFSAASNARNLILVYGLRSLLFTVYGLFLWRMYQTMRGATGGGGSGSNQDVPGKILQQQKDAPVSSFSDIQGIDDAKNEVMELVDTLRNPDKYAILGARAPTGLLLEGPPGTGKTMLARATAATAGVPLLYCSGSDFIELYVGRGAGRVRRLFERANRLSPCIIFVDELDALGKARDSGGGVLGNMASRANDEAEQTLNQLLTCMDGLDSNKRVCVLAATNRKEVLDPALVRPGRFDRIVTLKLPDAKGRENILRVHANKLPGFEEGSGVDSDRLNSLGKGSKVDLSAVAAVTSGLSGAELEFIVNEAAIRAVRRVSAALRQGVDVGTAHVDSTDFEASVANFVETRRKSGSGTPGDFMKNVFK